MLREELHWRSNEDIAISELIGAPPPFLSTKAATREREGERAVIREERSLGRKEDSFARIAASIFAGDAPASDDPLRPHPTMIALGSSDFSAAD